MTDVINEPLAAETDGSSDGPTLAVSVFSTYTWGGPIAISGKLTVYATSGGTLRVNGVISAPVRSKPATPSSSAASTPITTAETRS